MPSIIFATCDDIPSLTPSDALLAAALERAGASVSAASWRGAFTPFGAADQIVVRSTWDYQSQAGAFEAWLSQLESHPCVINPPALMRWNMNKTYLLELAARGAPLPPTLAVTPDAGAIGAAMEALGLEEAVVKPVIGAGASGLTIARRNDQESLAGSAAALQMGGLVQPLLSDIRRVGETSLFYADGAFTHAVVKRAKRGDIRIQEEHGGRSALTQPPAFAVAQGREILDLLPQAPVYARVDVVILDGEIRLMEVELIEPELFFNYCLQGQAETGAADRFADALMRRL